MARHLDDLAKGLAEPNRGTGETRGDDGLLILTASQANEAIANTSELLPPCRWRGRALRAGKTWKRARAGSVLAMPAPRPSSS